MENTAKNREIHVTAQYIKDLSFENPQAPKSFGPHKEKPDTKIMVDINAGKLGDNRYEVELKITAKAEAGSMPVFMAELAYAGIFVITGIEDSELEPTLLVYAPSLLFPFARRIIADATRDGGFPPLMLEPVDFARLYMERRAAEKNKAANN